MGVEQRLDGLLGDVAAVSAEGEVVRAVAAGLDRSPKTGLFCSISDKFWNFLSLQRLQHKKVLVAHMDRRLAPLLWRGNNLFMLQPLQR